MLVKFFSFSSLRCTSDGVRSLVDPASIPEGCDTWNHSAITGFAPGTLLIVKRINYLEVEGRSDSCHQSFLESFPALDSNVHS